ncbi:MAG: glycosyltransferase [Anaerolineales bacterium]|nr:glycosyltransferase [Anaerolineales bacterium]
MVIAQPKADLPAILFLGTQMELAGAQRNMLAQATWFQEQGYPVQVVFFYDKQGLQEKWRVQFPVPLISLDGWKRGVFPLFNLWRLSKGLWQLYRLLKPVDVIITFTPHSNLLGLPVAWLAGVAVRIGSHRGQIEGMPKFLQRMHGWLTNSRICSILVAVSAQVRQIAIRDEGARPERVVVIENGIAPLPVSGRTLATTRKDLGIPANGLFCLTVGRMMVQKGHTYLLDAAAGLATSHPDIYYIFVGDGPLRPELEAKTKQLGLADRVVFLGLREDVGDLLHAADVFVQPSLWEGLSRALLEALFAGKPVLATAVEGVVDVVVTEESALLVPPKDVAALATALGRLAKEPQLRRQLAEAGRQRAESSFSLEIMCRAYEKLIQEMIHA